MSKGDTATSKKNIDLGLGHTLDIPTDSEKGFPLLYISDQYYSFNDLIVDDEIKERLEYIISENQNAKQLLSYGLKPKQKILFCGLPGTGKTLSAKIVSSVIGYPLVYVLFDSIVSSFLGQTASNLRKIFDFIEKGKYVVLFDEFDIVGKRRDDSQEHGEVKRVVNNFMQMLDNYNGESILIAATNHQHLLDTAIWRRFDEVILFKVPTVDQRKKLFEKYLGVLRKNYDFDLTFFVKKTANYSSADIANICEDALRRTIIHGESKVTVDDVLWAIKEKKRRRSIMLGK
ncbi:MAG: ATP-binding protein [Thaumarchaeota archaeon]|nr:ATP-binding protein [Nitrososphaerota archaeon]